MNCSDPRRSAFATLRSGAVKALAVSTVSLAVLSSCGSRSGAGAPRLSTIPSQSTTGNGAMFAVDLDPFVTDPEGNTLTFTVVSGVGSFSGSVYQGVFDTVGEFEIVFQVSDAFTSSQGSFEVAVTQADFAVVQGQDTGLSLLDTNTRTTIPVTSTANTETFNGGLSTGELLFTRQVGSQTRLFVFDSFNRTLDPISDEPEGSETFVGTTQSNLVVFKRDGGLFSWNPVTRFTRTIDADPDTTIGNVLISIADVIYYERLGTSAFDIRVYSPSLDNTVLVSESTTLQTLITLMPAGAVLFSRLSGTGETDLFYFNSAVGTVEVAGDREGTLGGLTKTFITSSEINSTVVFTTPGTVANTASAFYWTPGSATTVDIDLDIDFNFEGVSSTGILVWSQEVTSQDDLFGINLTDGSALFTVSNDAATESFQGFASQGGTLFVVYERAGTPSTIQVYNTATLATNAVTSGTGATFRAILDNGDVVATETAAVLSYAPSTDTTTTVTTTLGAVAAAFSGAGADAGDFVIEVANEDLHLWDASAAALVVVSDGTTAVEFQAVAAGGEILFTRESTTAPTVSDLFFFDAVDSDSGQLTDGAAAGGAVDHSVVGQFSVDRS